MGRGGWQPLCCLGCVWGLRALEAPWPGTGTGIGVPRDQAPGTQLCIGLKHSTAQHSRRKAAKQ